MKTIAIANQKGGVGKTTTTLSLGAALAHKGHRTLVMDLDIQCNLTVATIGPLAGPGSAEAAGDTLHGMAEVLLDGVAVCDIIHETATPNLKIAPALDTLAGVDLALADRTPRDGVLTKVLEDKGLRSDFDFLLIDTAPYLGLLTLNALMAVDFILVPVSCEYLPLLGLKLLNKTLRNIRENRGAHFMLLGYLLTMYDRRERITGEAEELLRASFGNLVFPYPIRINTHLKAAPATQKTIFQYEDHTGKGVADYWAAADEVLRRTKTLAARPGGK